ncbi:MAG: DnaJ domain-containing protein [Thermodesulfobacteriota bacterium]
MKDYFQILGLEPDATADEIRRSYRRLAMRYHPDRNPDNPEAGERFREVAEAYGVLSDPAKRAAYERFRARGGGAAGGDFSFNQEDILRDLFNDPRFQQILQGLMADFARSGFRVNPSFLAKTFFGGRGLFMGGLFVFGSLAAPALLAGAKDRKRVGGKILKGLGRAVQSLLAAKGGKAAADNLPPATFHLRLSNQELSQGKWVQIQTPTAEKETLRVHIPPASRPGQRLRLRGKGHPTPDGPGDLFLLLEQEGV